MIKQKYLPKSKIRYTPKDIAIQQEIQAIQKIRDYANYSCAVISEQFARKNNCSYIRFGQPRIKDSLIRKNRTYISDKI